MKVKEEGEKVGLKPNIEKTKIMVSSPIISWQIDRETVADYFGRAPKSLQMVTVAMKLDGVGKEVGGGIRMGNTCKSMADSCQCDKNHYNTVK